MPCVAAVSTMPYEAAVSIMPYVAAVSTMPYVAAVIIMPYEATVKLTAVLTTKQRWTLTAFPVQPKNADINKQINYLTR